MQTDPKARSGHSPLIIPASISSRIHPGAQNGMLMELSQVVAEAGFRSPRPTNVGLGQNLPGHDERTNQD
jgi:hypothetical protein